MFIWGNISIYIASYYRVTVGDQNANQTSSFFGFTISLFIAAITMPISAVFSSKYNPKL